VLNEVDVSGVNPLRDAETRS